MQTKILQEDPLFEGKIRHLFRCQHNACQCLPFNLKDADCMKLAPSNKLEIGTYTSGKIRVIGSCTLLAVHPDTQCLQEVTFHVTSHEGSVVLSCATALDLCLIQPHSNLDSIPYSASFITNKANYPRKKKIQKIRLVSKPNKNVCSSKEQSPSLLPAQRYSVNQCVIQEDKELSRYQVYS